MSADQICDLDLKSLSEGIARRAIASVEATEAYLERIGRYDHVLQSYITVMAEHARARAKMADQELQGGHSRGPLHGVPLALKDLVAVAGVRMTAASRVMAEHVPTRDAAVTERLATAGAVLLGKLSMFEFAFGRPATTPPFATGRNPWDVTRDPSGSSSGSGVAVAAGLCAGALGSDTGGSIRNPAARCGLVGIKPTYGLVSRRGVVPLCWSLDHVGPLARTVWDAAVMLQAIAGRDPGDRTTREAPSPLPNFTAMLETGVRGLKLGVLSRFYIDWPGLHPDVRVANLAAFEELKRQGAAMVDVELPTLELATAAWATYLAESYALHADTVRRQPQMYREGTRTRIHFGALVTAQDLLQAQRIRARLAREASGLLERVDALIFPGPATPALRFEEVSTREVMPPAARYTSPWNLLGLPALVLPCGFSREGLPVSMQIVGRPFDEAMVFRIARAYERATDWHTRRPDPRGWRLG